MKSLKPWEKGLLFGLIMIIIFIGGLALIGAKSWYAGGKCDLMLGGDSHDCGLFTYLYENIPIWLLIFWWVPVLIIILTPLLSIWIGGGNTEEAMDFNDIKNLLKK